MLSSIQMLTVAKTPKLLLIGSVFAWVAIKYFPSVTILFWLVSSVALDFFTGLLKAWSKGEVTSSIGFRRTIVKIGTYVGTVVMVIILVNVVGIVDVKNKYDLSILIEGLMGFMVFIELYSICENISSAYPDSPLVKYMVDPIMSLLKGKLKNNSITSLSGKN